MLAINDSIGAHILMVDQVLTKHGGGAVLAIRNLKLAFLKRNKKEKEKKVKTQASQSKRTKRRNLKVSPNGLEFFTSQHLDFAAALVVGTAHLQTRNLQLNVGCLKSALNGLIIQGTEPLLQSVDTGSTKHVTTTETYPIRKYKAEK
jgi:hypothetical protein